MRQRIGRLAFTMIELLVTAGITAVLLALAISAVQRARSYASRVRCADNLRQIGLGLHAYHGTYEAFPPGVSVQGGDSAYPLMGWGARLLPFIDQQSLWERTDRAFQESKLFEQNPPHIGLNTVISLYACPEDDRTRVAQWVPQVRQEVALTSYLGIAGSDLATEDGSLFADSSVRISDIADGASNTLLVGERPPSTDLRLGWWYAGVGQDGRGSCDMVMGVKEINIRLDLLQGCSGGPFDFGPGSVTNQCDMFHFWSFHPGGAHFLLADGSVHFIAYSAAFVMPALASRAGGEAVLGPDS